MEIRKAERQIELEKLQQRVKAIKQRESETASLGITALIISIAIVITVLSAYL